MSGMTQLTACSVPSAAMFFRRIEEGAIAPNIGAILLAYLFYRQSAQRTNSYWKLRNVIFEERMSAIEKAAAGLPPERNPFGIMNMQDCGGEAVNRNRKERDAKAGASEAHELCEDVGRNERERSFKRAAQTRRQEIQKGYVGPAVAHAAAEFQAGTGAPQRAPQRRDVGHAGLDLELRVEPRAVASTGLHASSACSTAAVSDRSANTWVAPAAASDPTS